MIADARPPGPAGASTLKTAAIVFAGLAVASVGYTVYMFTQQSSLQAEADNRRPDLDLQRLLAGHRIRPRVAALARRAHAQPLHRAQHPSV